MRKGILLIVALSAISRREALGKPTEIATSSDTLNPVALTANNSETDTTREQRSPQFGLLGDYGDYSDYDDGSRHLHLGLKRKIPKPHKPFGLTGGHGCGDYGCGGYSHHQGGHHHGGQGSSFATASAGSIGGGPYGGQSQASAQSASFNIGPYSASFSIAESSSGHRRF